MKKVLVILMVLISITMYSQEYAQFRLVPKGLSGKYKVYFFENDKGYYVQDSIKKSDLEVGLLNTVFNYIVSDWVYALDYIDGDIRWYIVKRRRP